MRVASEVLAVVALFLVAGLLIGWGSGTAARGMRRTRRTGSGFRPQVGRWHGGAARGGVPAEVEEHRAKADLAARESRRRRAIERGGRRR